MTDTRRRLSHWGPWMIVAYLGLVGATVALYHLSSTTVKREAIHESMVARCISSRPQLRRISTHLKGVNMLSDVLVTNTEAVLASTPKNDPQRATRAANLARIKQAQKDIAAVKGLPVPTVAQCRAQKP